MQFRAEQFNAFNHSNRQNPDTCLRDSNVGGIASAHAERIVQFGFHFSFRCVAGLRYVKARTS